MVADNNDELPEGKSQLFEKSQTDFWHDLPVELKNGIKKAQSELNEGKGMPHEFVISEIRQRFRK